MRLVRRLGPGGMAPAWVDEVDRSCFGEAWPALEEREVLYVLEPHAAARWALIEASAEAELLRIAVHPEARRIGYGRELLRACTEALHARFSATGSFLTERSLASAKAAPASWPNALSGVLISRSR
jgi:ribosomal protein S18 acetylase RimI-like enzyme